MLYVHYSPKHGFYNKVTEWGTWEEADRFTFEEKEEGCIDCDESWLEDSLENFVNYGDYQYLCVQHEDKEGVLFRCGNNFIVVAQKILQTVKGSYKTISQVEYHTYKDLTKDWQLKTFSNDWFD